MGAPPMGVSGVRSPVEQQPNPFASLLAAHTVVSGDTHRGVSAPGGVPHTATGGTSVISPPNTTRAAVTATPTFDIGALPSLQMQSLIHQLQANSPGERGVPRAEDAAGAAGAAGAGPAPPPGSAAAAAAALRDLPPGGLGSYFVSTDLEAVLGQLGAPGFSDMETSLTGLGLNASLGMMSPQLAAALLDQQGASSSAWLQTHTQPLQHQGGGGAGMDGINTVTSGLDNMQSIEQALPVLDQETAQAYLARAQVNSQLGSGGGGQQA